MIQFQYNEFLLALAAVPLMVLLFMLVLSWKKRMVKKIGDPRLVYEMISNYSSRNFTIKFILIIFSFILITLAFANPRVAVGSQKVNRNGIDVMIALDVSKSMLAQDIKPSRLERAKQVISRLIDRLGDDRIGLVVFAGRAYLQMPLTGDQGAAKMYLASASTELVPTQGTVIGDALKMSAESFNPKEKKYKSVILISDGEDHDESALSIAGQLADEGVVIHTIGIGSPEGAPILDPVTNELKKDIEGNTVVTKLNENELKSIAAKGNGTYLLYSNTEDVVSGLYKQLSTMDRRTVKDDSLVNYDTYFQYFLTLALILLTLECLLSERKKAAGIWVKAASPAHRKKQRTGIARAKQAMPVMLFLLYSSAVMAQDDNEEIKKGNEAYNKKDYQNAAASYKKITGKDAANTTAQYNLGNALYKSSKTDEAINAYDNALSKSGTMPEKEGTFYNKGVVLQNNKKIPECIQAYKNALKLDPNDEDARQNLQKALQQQKQQQQKDKKDKDKNKSNHDQKQNKDQQPKPQPSKITKQDAEEKLKALLQQEKALQDKLRKSNVSSPNRPEKDW